METIMPKRDIGELLENEELINNYEPIDEKKEMMLNCIMQWENAGKPTPYSFKIGEEHHTIIKTSEDNYALVTHNPNLWKNVYGQYIKK